MPENKEIKKRGASVGERLFLTFALLAFLGVLLAVVAWFGLSSIERSHRKVVETSTPMMLEAYRLSEAVVHLLNLASFQSSLEDLEEIVGLKQEVDNLNQGVEQRIQRLRALSLSEVAVGEVSALLEQLNENISIENDLIQKQILHRGKLEEELGRVLEATDQIETEIRPVLAVMSLAEEGEEFKLQKVLQGLLQKNADVKNIVNQVYFLNARARLLDLKTAYTLQIRRMANQLVRIQDKALRKSLAKQLATLLQQLDGEDMGIFSLSLQQIAILDEIDKREQQNTQLSVALTAIISEIVTHAESIIQNDYVKADNDRRNAEYLLIILVIILVLIPVLVLFFYLKPKIIQRLDRLAENTASIAQGNLNTVINTSGDDELSAMARALDQFQQDLIEKKKAEDELKVSEERFRLVGELATDGYWDWDLKTNDEYMSPSFKRLFGYSDAEIPNNAEGWQKIIHPDDLAKAIEAFERHTQKGEPFNVAVRYFHKNGELVWVLCRGVALKDNAGEFYRMIGTHTDITELKQIERELAESNRELEQFAFIASHDLQEPLRTITGYVQLIERRYAEQLDTDGHEFMKFIVDGAQRMKTLIQDLLVYSRIGRSEIELEDFDLKEVVEGILSLLEAQIVDKKAEVMVPSNLPKIKADRAQISQLLQNLLSNAIKFSREGVTPKVSIQYQVEQEGPQKRLHRIAIEDNGIGIDSQYFEKMFLIFQRLNNRDAYPGTGIGLAICKKIVERHEGRLWVESKPGEGTTFYFTLPEN